ncbi:MAG TPA: hypothetical protein VF812_10820, partial [Ktedonobacterales bacterium]
HSSQERCESWNATSVAPHVRAQGHALSVARRRPGYRPEAGSAAPVDVGARSRGAAPVAHSVPQAQIGAEAEAYSAAIPAAAGAARAAATVGTMTIASQRPLAPVVGIRLASTAE